MKSPKLDLQEIGKELSNELIVAVRPYHPYLFSAPYLLLADSGSLVAVFIPKTYELKDPVQILVRQAISRLALAPPFTERSIVRSDRSSDYFREAVNYNFNEYLDISEVRSLKKFTLDKKAGEYLRTLPDEIKRRAFIQFEILFRESQKWTATLPKGDLEDNPQELFNLT